MRFSSAPPSTPLPYGERLSKKAIRPHRLLRHSACDVSFPLRVDFDEHPLMLDGRVSLFGEGSVYGASRVVETGSAYGVNCRIDVDTSTRISAPRRASPTNCRASPDQNLPGS